MDKDDVIPNTPPYKSNIFHEISKQSITMLCLILSYDYDRIVDEDILGFMSYIFPPSENPLTKFHYSQFLVDIIHYKLA